MKRADRRIRRTVGRIKRDDGDGGEPVGAHQAGPDARPILFQPVCACSSFWEHAQTTPGRNHVS